MSTYLLIQAGNQLQLVNEAGLVASPLPLPVGINLKTNVPPRFIVYGRYVILVNTPTAPLSIDSSGVVRILTPSPPRLGAVLTGTGTSTATISGNTLANPTVITTTTNTTIISGQQVTITGDTTSIPPINGVWTVSVLSADTFSIPVNVSTPGSGATVTWVGGGGGLSGPYMVKYTFIINDTTGNLISESDYSPISNTVILSTSSLLASGLDISPSAISARRLYRTSSGAAVFFQWIDLDGDILTQVSDDLPDAGLSEVAAPILGSPPDLTLIATFRDRLWGMDRVDIDNLRYTEVGLIYSWPIDNVFPVEPIGVDNVGVTALMARRDALGIGKQNQLSMLTGTDDTNFAIAGLSTNCGVVSQESVAIYRDTAYFLWEDGVYQWNDSGLLCISDKKGAVGSGSATAQGYGAVRSWFATDNYFDRTKFKNAFAMVDPVRNKYRLFLTPIGNPTGISWVEYDINTATWWGPHVTSAFSPTAVFTVLDGNLVPRPTIGGGDGNLYREQLARTDGASSPINMSVLTKHYSMSEPDLDKYWGELSVIGLAQPIVNPPPVSVINVNVGTLDYSLADTSDPNLITFSVNWDLTASRQRLERMGAGRHLQLEFTNTQLNQPFDLYGFEVDPVHILGRR